jgi:predicted transposase YbfD/YdcC
MCTKDNNETTVKNNTNGTAETTTLSLKEVFMDLADPRLKRRRAHELVDIMVISICCLLCGGSGFNDMEDFGKAKEPWFKTFLDLPNGIPSHDTFNRVYQAMNPQGFLDCFLRWTQSVRKAVSGEIVAIDGKALRRAKNRGEAMKYIVNAWAKTNGLVLGQVKVADKSNEITAVPELLRALDLAGCIVTIDAMGCQKKIAKEIKEADAEYVLALKGNHETVHEEVKAFLDDAIVQAEKNKGKKKKVDQEEAKKLDFTQSVQKDHGRHEIRRCWQSEDLAWFADIKEWEGLRSVGAVELEKTQNGQTTIERRYFISSLGLGAAKFACAVRDHWGVENQLHWVLDVTFGEDQSRVRTGHAAENLSTLRRLAMNLLKKDSTKKRGIKAKQLNAAWDISYLSHLLGF